MTPLLLLLAALANRIRGGGLSADRWPGHSRLYAAPGMAVVAWLAGAGWVALVWGLGFFVWSTLPVNRWDVLGRTPQGRPTWPEAIIEAVADHLPLPMTHGPLFVRECAGIAPCLTAVALFGGPWWLWTLAPVYAALAVAVTEVAHWLPVRKFRVPSDLGIGGLWGILLVLAI